MKPDPTLAILTVMILGCGGTTGLEGRSLRDASADAPEDVIPDVVADSTEDPSADPVADTGIPDLPMGPEITFVLGFITDIPGYEYLYVQSSDELGHQRWVSIVREGGAVSLQSRCDICPCDTCVGCPVCGIAMPIVLTVPGGESVSWTWGGITYPLGTCVIDPTFPAATCQDSGTLDPGEYVARFCFAVAGEDAFPDGWITDPWCEDVAFTYPVPGGVVEYLVNNGG